MTAAVERGRDLGGIGLLWVAVVGAAQVASIALGVGPPLQPLLSIVFVLTCPGFLLLGLEQPKDLSARIVIAIGGSLALNIAIATVVLVGDARWIAPIVAVVLIGLAALPQRSLRSVAARLGVATARTRSEPLALPAGEPTQETVDAAAVAAADAGETQVGQVVAFGDVPEVTALEVPVLDERVRIPRLIDLNVAGADAMMALPGVGPALAARIVAYREEQGPYESFDDLLRVPGIGPSKLKGFPSVAQVMVHPADVVADEGVAPPAPAELDATSSPGPAGSDETVPAAANEEDAAPEPPVVVEPEYEPVIGETPPGSGGVPELPTEPQASPGSEPTPAATAEEPSEPQLVMDVEDRQEAIRPDGPVVVRETESPAPAAATGDLVDLNSAGLDELMSLPGVGRDLASRILAARWTGGPFKSIADLKRVSGLGPRRIRDIEPLVSIGGSGGGSDALPGEPATAGAVDPDVSGEPGARPGPSGSAETSPGD